MSLRFALAALLALAAPASAQQAYCPYGQTCQTPNGTPVPFPVINPLAGLNVLNQGKQQQTPPPALQPTTPTPPPVMPPQPGR